MANLRRYPTQQVSTPLVQQVFTARRKLTNGAVPLDAFGFSPQTSAVTGWHRFSQSAGDAAGTAFTGLANLYNSDDSRATITLAASAASEGAFLWSTNGLYVPPGKTILGFEVLVEGAITAGSLDYFGVTLVNANTFQPNSVTPQSANVLTGTETQVTIGSPTNVWGGVDADGGGTFDRAWTPADTNSTDFGVYFYLGASTSGATVQLDTIQVRVTYGDASGASSAAIASAGGVATTSTLAGSSTATTAVTLAAGVASTATLTGSSTAVTAPSTAGGTSTSNALAGRSTAAAVLSNAAGTATTASLTGSGVSAAAMAPATGSASASLLAATSTAASTVSAASGVSATASLAAAATAQSAITTVGGIATAGTLAGSSTAEAAFDSAAGASATSALAGSSTAAASVQPAGGVATAQTLSSASGSVVSAAIDPAIGTSTTGTLIGTGIQAPLQAGGGGFATVRVDRIPYPEEPEVSEPDEVEEPIKVEERAPQGAPEPRQEAIEALRHALAPRQTPTITIDVADIKADLAALAAERALARAQEEEMTLVLLLAAQARRNRNPFARHQ